MKMSSGKRRPSCLGLNVLTHWDTQNWVWCYRAEAERHNVRHLADDMYLIDFLVWNALYHELNFICSLRIRQGCLYRLGWHPRCRTNNDLVCWVIYASLGGHDDLSVSYKNEVHLNLWKAEWGSCRWRAQVDCYWHWSYVTCI